MSLLFRRSFLLATLFLALGVVTSSQAQSTLGVVEGRVVDSASGTALPGARVAVQGSTAETASDREGRFQLALPSGPQTLIVSYLGRPDQTVDTSITAGATQRVDVLMGLAAYREAVTVTATLIADAQGRALNQQKTAPNITNVISADQIGAFPDR